MTKNECIDNIESIDWYDEPTEIFYKLWDTAIDYDTSLEGLFDEYITYEDAENYVKEQLENNGLLYAKHCLEDITDDTGIYTINGNGWLENVGKEELKGLRDRILSRL